jgi:hypothetical protein
LFDERTHHPSLFNPFLVRSNPVPDLRYAPGTVFIPNRVFGVDEMRHLNVKYNYGNYADSHLARLAPSTLGNAAVLPGQLNPRWAITTQSFDIDRPGATASAISPQPYIASNIGQPIAQPRGIGTAVDPTGPAPATADYDDAYRSKLTSLLGPMNLNRKLTEYRLNALRPYGPNNVAGVQQLARAQEDRQRMARDIFLRLQAVTGSPTDQGANRWLAQVAVNIVDFIDSDDVITAFKWDDQNGGAGQQIADNNYNNDPLTFGQTLSAYSTTVQTNNWVFGFERPRVNINEAYHRIENDPMDTFPVDPNDMKRKAELPFDLKIWLELHNPITPASQGDQFSGPEGYPDPANAPDDNVHGGYRAALKDTMGGNEASAYRVLLYKVQAQQAGGNLDPMGMRPRPADNNVAGLPPTNATVSFLNVLNFHRVNNNDWVDETGTVIPPNLQAQYRDQSFYLAGPQLDQQGGMGRAIIPGAQANFTSRALQTKVQFTEYTPPPQPGMPARTTWSPGLVLQRLANPALAPSSTNPYISLDYFESDPVAVNIRLKYDNQGNTFNTMTPGQEPDWNTTYAWGRRQPHDAVIQYTAPGNPAAYRQTPNGVMATDINHTLGQHNGQTAQNQNTWPQQGDQTLQLPFFPLAHYDRILISPMELMHVSALKPHDLTHEFGEAPNVAPGANTKLQPNNGRLKYTVDWLDHGVSAQAAAQGSYLYRAFDFLRTPTPMMGLGMGGRVPGKVNINTIFAQEVFEAVLDQNSANRFTQQNVLDAWTALVTARQNGAAGQIRVDQGDRPFTGTATMIDVANQLDRRRTLVRPDMLWNELQPWHSVPPNQSENYTPGQGGYASAVEKYEMLSKVFNQFTTRSNTFAVYLTVGYFEVKNAGPYNEANRPVLGRELGELEGNPIRHRFFSVLDRTNLSIEAPTQLVAPGQPIAPIKQGQAPVYLSYEPNTPLPTAPAYSFANTEDPAPGAPLVEVKIPAIGQDALGRILGYYDGTLWTIQTGANPSVFMLDQGDKQEQVAVQQIVGYDAASASAVIRLSAITQPHSRGAIMRLLNPDPSRPVSTPGNPGPQPGFDYKSPRYAPVVKYVEQLK